ncbi:Ectonucleoside triphosphate diphosphohydrolase 5 [Halotydeus destructor]|nr:Ectonucleoside triphosphate diphosphohydrolase 5 [Halotydeus destructor]
MAASDSRFPVSCTSSVGQIGRPRVYSSQPSFAMAFIYLVMSSLVIRVGPFVSLNGHSLHKGARMWLNEPLIWLEELNQAVSKTSKRSLFANDTDDKRNRVPTDTCSKDEPCAEIPVTDTRQVKQRYAVIFDGGSTGTRVSVFVFNKTVAANGRKVLVLANDHFGSIKPGLSSYADHPAEAANSLQPLMELVNAVVPENLRGKTPMLLRATAGLRLLPSASSEAILYEVYSYLSGFGFRMSSESVSILDGDSEGTYAWITINSLLNRLNNPKASVAVMDLGGGSTQLAFTPSVPETLTLSASKVQSKSIVGKEHQLYTHSYLGYGLMSARKSLLTYPFEDKSIFNNKQAFVSHPCFTNEVPATWTFENTVYYVNGTVGDCYSLAVEFVNAVDQATRSKIVESPKELNNRVIYAISYYYDRAVELGIVDSVRRRGSVRVKDFYYYAKEVCRAGTVSALRRRAKVSTLSETELRAKGEEMPFLCMDLSYIAALLREGFGLRWDKELHLTNQLKGVETSWALGAAYDLFS